MYRFDYSDKTAVGYGNMDLDELMELALRVPVEAVILESHKNWAEKSPIKSLQMSATFLNERVS